MYEAIGIIDFQFIGVVWDPLAYAFRSIDDLR